MAEKNTAKGIASESQNDKLEHTEGGVTTRDDATDLGVPMLQGDGSEPVGPEDALGPGPKRGDYSKRLGDANYAPHEVTRTDEGVTVVDQAPRASEQGEVKGVKGGVDTEPTA